MKRTLITTLIFFLFSLGLISSQVAFGAKIDEEVTLTPGKPLSYARQERISFLAVKVLRHIAKARGYIHEKNTQDARREINKAQKLVEKIRAALPTTKIRDHIWVAKKHLSYEDTEEVIPDLLPIYVSLDAIQDFVPVEDVKAHINKAGKALEEKDKKRCEKELELADQGLVYVEVDLPLGSTERKVAEAEQFLAQGKEKEADEALNEAEEGVQIISLIIYEPMSLAENSLWQATKYYARDKFEAARKALADAEAYLKSAAKRADRKTKETIAALREKIDDLGKKMEKGGDDFTNEINELWDKSKELFRKTVDKFK